MLKRLLPAVLCLPSAAHAQLVDTRRNVGADLKAAAVCSKNSTLATLERGVVEATASGVLQASSQLIRLCIGDPNPASFRVPVYFFVGAVDPAGAAGDAKALASLLNPLGGNANLALIHDFTLWHITPDSPNKPITTKFSIAYEISAKYLTGTAAAPAQSKVPTVAGYGDLGFRYQTGAFNLDNPSDFGVFWVQAKVAGAFGSSPDLKKIFGDSAKATVPAFNADAAIDLKSFTLKASLQRVLQDAGVKAWEGWHFRFGFDFKPGSGT